LSVFKAWTSSYGICCFSDPSKSILEQQRCPGHPDCSQASCVAELLNSQSKKSSETLRPMPMLALRMPAIWDEQASHVEIKESSWNFNCHKVSWYYCEVAQNEGNGHPCLLQWNPNTLGLLVCITLSPKHRWKMDPDWVYVFPRLKMGIFQPAMLLVYWRVLNSDVMIWSKMSTTTCIFAKRHCDLLPYKLCMKRCV